MVSLMEVFSLQDDEARDLFITQTPKEDNLDVLDNGNFQFGVDKNDFQSPCVSLVDQCRSDQYSDIFDVEEDCVFMANKEPNFG